MRSAVRSACARLRLACQASGFGLPASGLWRGRVEPPRLRSGQASAPPPTRGKTPFRRVPDDARVRWGLPDDRRGSGSASGCAARLWRIPRERGPDRLQGVLRTDAARWRHCAAASPERSRGGPCTRPVAVTRICGVAVAVVSLRRIAPPAPQVGPRVLLRGRRAVVSVVRWRLPRAKSRGPVHPWLPPQTSAMAVATNILEPALLWSNRGGFHEPH